MTHSEAPDEESLVPLVDVDEVLLIVADADGRVRHFNERCVRLSGLTPSEAVGRPLREALRWTGETAARDTASALLTALSGEPSVHRSVDWRTADGVEHTLHWTGSRLDAAGDDLCVVCTGVDVGSRLRASEALAEGQARLRAVVEAVVDGIITIGEDALIESVNPAVERLFGWSRGELIGQPVTMLMPEPYHSNHDSYMHNYRATGERRIIGIGREVEGLRKDGSVFPLELAVSEVHLPGRRMFTGVLRDVSARRRAEEEARLRLEELAHASRLADLGELTSSIAHEINQPLAAIVSFAEACLRMLRAGTGSPEVLRGALEQISAQGERAGNIVHNLRQFVRKGTSMRVAVDVNVVIRDVIGLLSHDLRQRRVELELDLADGMPRVLADRVQVGQVTFNLVRNALDALRRESDAPRVVRVASACSGSSFVEVAVSDSGVGLPPDGPQRVFETFFTTKPEGLGIGLSICRSLVEAHGGRLTAESRQGGGATFRFTLPVAPAGDDDG